MQRFGLDVKDALAASMAAPPACSTMKLMGLASYIRRSLPFLPLAR